MSNPEPWQGLTLPQLARDTAARVPDLCAIRFMDREVTFAALDAASDRVAAALAAQGYTTGDRIALYCINSDAFAMAYFGILKCGATVVPINLLLNPREIAYILNDSGAKALLYFEAFTEAVDAFLPDCPGIGQVIRISQDGPRDGEQGFADLLSASGPVPEPDLDPEEDVAAIIYTSGTTGKPKGAMLTHRNLVANTFSVKEALQLVPGEDVILVVLPMFHAFAAMVGLLFPVCHGCTLAAVPKFDPQLVAETVRSTGATVLPMVPSMFSVMLRLPAAFDSHLDSLKYAISGGAAMPVEVMKAFEKRYNKPVYEGDGPTECSPVTCVNPIGGETRPGSVGHAVPHVEMRILDEQGNELPTGEIGEICVRGPNVMKGYLNRPEETAEAFFNDWLRTGDLGMVDEEKYFYIVDRKKDMIIVNGMNVYPRVIEEILYQMPGVREAAVVGRPNKLHGEIPEAYIALDEDIKLDAPAVKQFCREHLGIHEIPKRVHFVDELPKNAAGKINKRELRKQGEIERGIVSAG